jgi:hypothetical protein
MAITVGFLRIQPGMQHFFLKYIWVFALAMTLFYFMITPDLSVRTLSPH